MFKYTINLIILLVGICIGLMIYHWGRDEEKPVVGMVDRSLKFNLEENRQQIIYQQEYRPKTVILPKMEINEPDVTEAEKRYNTKQDKEWIERVIREDIDTNMKKYRSNWKPNAENLCKFLEWAVKSHQQYSGYEREYFVKHFNNCTKSIDPAVYRQALRYLTGTNPQRGFQLFPD